MSPSYSVIILGIILIGTGLTYFIYMIRVSKKTEKDDYMIISFHIRKYVAIAILIVIGLILLIKEIMKIF